MVIVRKLSFLLISVLVFNTLAIAQKSPAAKADEAFRTYQYSIAADLYKKAYGAVKKNPVEKRRIMFRMAECYSMMGDVKRAEQQYLRLEKQKAQKDYPVILLRLGDIYRVRKDYPTALSYFEKYKAARPSDPRVDSRIESCKLAPQWINNPTRHEVENMKKFNTAQSEWAPSWGVPGKENEIVFTSSREGGVGKGEDVWSGQSFSDLYISTKPKSKLVDFPGEWTTPVLMDKDGIINTESNEGESSFNEKGTTIYFTRCPNEKKTLSHCKIYQATKKGKTWGAAEEIIIGPDSFDYVHPAISSNELTLYFASDMPGTNGGFDIWAISRPKKTSPFGNPVNLGLNVNSYDHEMFPSLENDSTLYFASKGHVGLGGYDIFKSQRVDGKWTPAENLKHPINSEADDYGIIFDHGTVIDPASGFPFIEKGYFTSNRAGGRGMDDIWSFKLRPIVFTLSGFVRDSVTRQFIDGATVTVTSTDGTLSYTTMTDIRGYYSFDKNKILGETTYDILVQKSGYFDNDNCKGRETTVGLTENKDLKRDFILNPIPKEPIPMPDILYKLADWVLLPASIDSLQSLLKTMEDNPTLVIELRSHTDNRPIPMTNDTLSQRRAQSCVDYLIESGIDPERLVAKGYAERVPRTLERDITSRGVTFKKGTVLTREYINALKTTNEREAAHDLNRRTEFMILRDDFVPKETVGDVDRTKSYVTIVDEVFIPVEVQENIVYGTCYVNSKTARFMIENGVEKMAISYDQAMRFLREAIIKVGDFELGEKAIVSEDGTIIDKSVVYLNTLQIGDQMLENVEMIVIKGQKEPIVIGSKIFEEEFGTYTVNAGEGKLIFNK